jgi:uncharacterized protein YbaA (DUF1428 family)
MYSSIYIYPVPAGREDEFLEIQREALEIYRAAGAIDDATYRPVMVDDRYGCLGFGHAVELRDGERVWISVSFFRDREHHDAVMAHVDADERIDQLFERIQQVVDVGRVVRGEFERAV